MRRFWLCIFFITCISVFAEDAVTRATSYGSENVKSDAVTSATEYTGTPKKFKNGKIADNQSTPIITEKETKEKQKPEVVLSQRTDDESLRTESAMRFLPETFEYNAPAEQPAKKIPASAVPYYQPYSSELSSLPMSKENMPAEAKLAADYQAEMKTLPGTFEKEKPVVALSDENIDEEKSGINSEMLDLPKTYEKMPAEAKLAADYQAEMKTLPGTFEKEKPVVALSDENIDEEKSGISSEMLDLPKIYEKMPAEAKLAADYHTEMETLPGTFEKEKPVVALSDENIDGEKSGINSEMLELPLPNALFEENKEEGDLPFIWDEDSEEEEPVQNDFRNEDLPTLIDVPEVSLGETEEAKVFDIPEAEFLEDEEVSALPEEPVESDEYREPEDFAESDKDFNEANEGAEPEIALPDNEELAENEIENYAAESSEPEMPQSLPSESFSSDDENDSLSDFDTNESEWVFKKDSRKLMDFNENFDGFPKSADDVFNNPAQYQYDDEKLVVESGRKIDNIIGQQLFDSAIEYIKENENAKAVKLLKELLHYNFSVPETEHLLALAEFKNVNHDEAMKYLQRSLRKYKNPYLRAENMELQGEINFSQKNYNEAYQNFMAAIVGVNTKRDAELYNKAGIAALRAGDIEKARKAWKIGKYLGSRDAKRNLLWLDH